MANFCLYSIRKQTLLEKWSCHKIYGKCKIFLVAVYMIFKYNLINIFLDKWEDVGGRINKNIASARDWTHNHLMKQKKNDEFSTKAFPLSYWSILLNWNLYVFISILLEYSCKYKKEKASKNSNASLNFKCICNSNVYLL